MEVCMTGPAESKNVQREPRGQVMLRGASVMNSFRDNLFDACNRAGVTPNEFVLQAAAEKLKASGREFSGLFAPGDISDVA
jgi:hypothetical protein